MKVYRLLFVLSFLLVFTQCEQLEMELNKGDNLLEITSLKDRIELDASNPELEALKLIWTTGSNQGTNSAIEYTFQMDVKGNDFSKGISLELGREVYEKIYKNEELNKLLIETFGVPENEYVTVEVRVIAKVTSDNVPTQISARKTIIIKTHSPITNTLYIIGSATSEGWDASKATEMRAVANAPKNFTWTGTLSAGEFKFITTLGQFVPSYNKGDDSTKLYLRESFDDTYDEKFTITESGVYTLKANLITKTISITKEDAPEYSELWFVGNPTGWSFMPMNVDPIDPFIFHYNADLSAGGEFKIGTVAGNWDAVFFRPVINQTSEGTNLDVDKWAGGEDYKWNITGGVYKITLNTRSMKIDIVPFTPYPAVYLIGSATSIGWDIGNAEAMIVSSDPNVLTWEGQLNQGELKFTCDKQTDWNGAWFLASEANKTPTGDVEQMIFSYPGAGADTKWNIQEAGTYQITLNQLKETIIIKKK